MAPISSFIILSLLITLGYFIGILNFLSDHEENKCEMTFMFEYPQFVRVSVPVKAQFKKYGLYAYSEGRFTQRTREMRFDGIPVLFIPGNAGSYKQVRSFASVAFRKSLDSRAGFHFDFFTVNLNDELSGLNGALLDEQMQFVNQSIAQILQLYKDKYSPKTIVIIGHSMGGIIARALLANLPEGNVILPLVITLATPHARPPLALDSFMTDFYHNLEKGEAIRRNSTVVALSGGYNDMLVPPFITYPRNFQNVFVTTTSVPLVWFSIDHLCILWCKQLVLAVTRGLFDVVDLHTKQISLNTDHHQKVFQHHLVQNSGIKIRRINLYKRPYGFGKGHAHWMENLQKQYTVYLAQGTKQPQWHMLRLLSDSDYKYVMILAINLQVTDWAFGCEAVHVQDQYRTCSEGIHLSHLSEIAPSIKYKRRILRLNLHELKRNYSRITHAVAHILPTNEPVILHIDRYGENERKIEVNLPRWWSFNRQLVLRETPKKILYYELVLPQLQHVIQSYKLYVEPLKCSRNIYHVSASLVIPWSSHGIQGYISETERNPLHVRLYNSRPNNLNNSFPTIYLTLDPICTYSIRISNSFSGMLGQIARTYSPMLIANMAAVILLSFRNQLVSIHETGSCSLFFSAIKHGIKPYYILTMVKLVSRILSWKGLAPFLPLSDWQIIAEEGNDFFLLPLLLYMCSVGIVWLGALALSVSFILCESTIHRLAMKFLACVVTGTTSLSNWLISGFHKLPCIVACILIVLSMTTCGGLALCLGCGFYFLKLTQMSQEYVETLVVRIVKYLGKMLKKRLFSKKMQDESDMPEIEQELNEEKEHVDVQGVSDVSQEDIKEETNEEQVTHETRPNDEEHLEEVEPLPENVEQSETSSNDQGPSVHSHIFFHFSIFMLWFIVAGLSLPSVLTWAHNFKYSTVLQPDPSFLPGLVLSICAIPLWHMDLPKCNIYGYLHLGHILNVMATICLIYAPISIYRLTYVITTTIVLIALHQLWAPKGPEIDIISEDNTEDQSKTMYDEVKTKWE